MIFKSKMQSNGLPIWELNTATQTVTHINPKTGETESYSFHTDHVEAHLNYVAENYPERLQKLVDNGEIYSYLDEFEIKVTDAINEQVQHWLDEDREYQIALEKSDLYRVNGLGNMIRQSARDAVYKVMVYV
jgi:hypothetical protein